MGRARRWSWVLVLVVGAALFELVRRSIVSTGNPNLVPSLILLGAAVVPAAFVAFIAGRRLVFDVSAGTVALTGLIGGVVHAPTTPRVRAGRATETTPPSTSTGSGARCRSWGRR